MDNGILAVEGSCEGGRVTSRAVGGFLGGTRTCTKTPFQWGLSVLQYRPSPRLLRLAGGTGCRHRLLAYTAWLPADERRQERVLSAER